MKRAPSSPDATRALFQDSEWAGRFAGNIEGRDIYEGRVRVVICDGFVGNVLLKAGEGAVEFLFSTLKEELARLMPDLPGDAGPKMAASLRRLKSRFEYEEFGGGPLLGIRGACIICHGSSGTRAIKNALRVAGTMAEDRLATLIVEQLAGAAPPGSVDDSAVEEAPPAHAPAKGTNSISRARATKPQQKSRERDAGPLKICNRRRADFPPPTARSFPPFRRGG